LEYVATFVNERTNQITDPLTEHIGHVAPSTNLSLTAALIAIAPLSSSSCASVLSSYKAVDSIYKHQFQLDDTGFDNRLPQY